MREVPPAGGSGTLRFLLMDHLGGTVEVLDSSGATVSELKYWPFGATRSGSITQTDKLYTGQQQEPGDAALGLYNYKARFYSTTLGRFLSADAITKDGLNRYSYAKNSPVGYGDPSGRCVQDSNSRWMECSRKTMIQYFFCAWDGDCNTNGHDESLVRTFARAVVEQ